MASTDGSGCLFRCLSGAGLRWSNRPVDRVTRRLSLSCRIPDRHRCGAGNSVLAKKVFKVTFAQIFSPAARNRFVIKGSH